MSDRAAGDFIDRRTILLGATASAALLAWMGGLRPAAAQEAATAAPVTPAINDWQETLARLTRDSKPIEGKTTFEVPGIAENGNTVPFTASVDSPMTEADHVRAIHVVCTANPMAHIASFHFTLASGRAAVTGRMRLLQSQDVLMVAELGNGAFVVSRREVKVTVGGCGG